MSLLQLEFMEFMEFMVRSRSLGSEEEAAAGAAAAHEPLLQLVGAALPQDTNLLGLLLLVANFGL